jgi:prepilin-type N-terminal cleavage/methylation domain-containing protein
MKPKKITLKRNKNRRGFTLGEVVTTVAIIGTLTAVAVPNYLRIKMEVNMETVRQELKKIQVHMNDLLNRNKQFPQDINSLGNNDEEQAITASLNAIDLKEYTTDGYQPSTNFSNYQFRTCPRRIGIGGDKCFTVSPMGISAALAIAPPPPSFVNMYVTRGNTPDFDLFTGSSYLTDEQKLELFSLWMEQFAYYTNFRMLTHMGKTYEDLETTAPSYLFFQSQEVMDAIKTLSEQPNSYLKDKGIQIFFSELTKEEALQKNGNQYHQGNVEYQYDMSSKQLRTEPSTFELAFKLTDPKGTLSGANYNTALSVILSAKNRAYLIPT